MGNYGKKVDASVVGFLSWVIQPMWYAFFGLLLVYAWQHPSLFIDWFITFFPVVLLMLVITIVIILILAFIQP